MAVLLSLALACRQAEVPGTARAEPTLAAQIAAVEAGSTVEIRSLGKPVTDADLRAIGRLANLERLNIGNGQFTDAGLAQLVSLEELTLLRVRAPLVTDDGLRQIAQLPALRFLHLIDIPVTDAGIAHLSGMSQLESFYLDGGRATDEGLGALLKSMPRLHFHRDQSHLHNDPLAD